MEENSIKEMLKKFEDSLLKKIDPDGKISATIDDMFGTNIICKDYKMLDTGNFFDELKKNTIKGADCIAVYKQKGSTVIFATYCKDGNPLPNKINKYIVFDASKITKDVESLFNDSEIVLLR